jgi:hypothetical protein
MPEEIRSLCEGLSRDVAVLQLKWDAYRGLFATREVTDVLSDTAPVFFRVVAESLRNDLVQSICRLSDPSRSLGPGYPSLATLVARCTDIPRVEDLFTAFQSACGPVRRYRHQHLGHEDPDDRLRPREGLLPDVGRLLVDEILLLAAGVLKVIHRHYSEDEPQFRPDPVGGVAELVRRLEPVREREHKG